jgi:hypothetical protein
VAKASNIASSFAKASNFRQGKQHRQQFRQQASSFTQTA